LTASDVPLVLARWLHFLSLAVALGASLFSFYAAPRRPVASCAYQGVTDRIARLCAHLALASGILWVTVSIAEIGDGIGGVLDPDTLSGFFLETAFGPAWIVKLALLVGLAALAAVGGQGGFAALRRGLLVLLSAGALASQAWLGHAAMASGGRFGVELVCYIVHVLAAAAWIGALVPLAVLSSARTPHEAGPDALSAYSGILQRFSDVGVGLVLAILVTGIANATFRLDSLAALTTTEYGYTLLAKAVLFALMLSVAATNRWLILPNVPQSGTRAIAALRRTILAEQALAALVLLAAAILGILAP
jgi:putative copper resistance protein D